ncbi:MAG: EamA family transporter, partial [Woeseiaceae bacterium]
MPTAHPVRAVAATTAAMLAFAGNSILCRLALMSGTIDPATFTSVRLLSGAAALAVFLAVGRPQAPPLARGSWRSAFMLFLYAAGFSWAYVSL